MSITFQIHGAATIYTFESDQPTALNVNNRSARELFDRLDIAAPDHNDWHGCLPASELAERCRDALESMEAWLDQGVAPRQEGRFIEAGREPGYINARLREVLSIAIAAGDDGTITWA